MSPAQHAEVADRPLFEAYGRDEPSSWPTKPEQVATARELVRLCQCQICSLLLKDAVTLPCGRSLCRRCLPPTYERANISYPAGPERLLGVQCPFPDCGKEHAVGDCGGDVILNKALHHLEDNLVKWRKEKLNSSTTTVIAVDEQEDGSGDELGEKSAELAYRRLPGGRLTTTWALMEQGQLRYDAEVAYDTESSSTNDEYADFEVTSLHATQEEARSEMDCHVCFALFWEPLTTACGHTFCRSCLQRTLDHSQYCPICRRQLAINPLLNQVVCPSNSRLSAFINTFWKDELKTRGEMYRSEQLGQHGDFDIPLFVCTLAFPRMPTFLHIFEPRYRLMIRRALEGDKTFGMVLPRRARASSDPYFHELGTLLRITNAHFYPDGRSLIETIGISRFRVTGHGMTDGYAVGKIERIDDISLEEEEASEAQEISPASSERGSTGSPTSMDRKSRSSDTPRGPDLDAMSTAALMEFALAFVARMRAQSVPWLTARMTSIYGECPGDPGLFPWWLASILPVRDIEKYRLLGTSSVRDRLKICCSWIVEWETSAWSSLPGCTIL